MKYLVVGLGNIGAEYANTRHNIGFVVADALAQSGKVTFTPDRLASVAKVRHRGKLFVVIKPSTYMNLSGKAVRYWLDKEKLSPEQMLVVVDDIALPPGVLRMRGKGSDGGHNGLISITETLGTDNYPRLRFGIGNDFAQGYQVEYVLGKWTAAEEKLLLPRIQIAAEMVLSFGINGVDRTMSQYNSR